MANTSFSEVAASSGDCKCTSKITAPKPAPAPADIPVDDPIDID